MSPFLLIAAALGSALVAGIFFAFSTFVMPAIAAQERNRAVAVMQTINVTVLCPWFFGAFFGTGLICLAVIGFALPEAMAGHRSGIFVGSGLYLIGCLGVTVARNVPLNEELKLVDPESSASAAAWQQYYGRWMFWNHVRSAASFAAAAIFAWQL